MPTFEKRGKRWRVQVMRGGKRISKSFALKSEAQAWAADETSILEGKKSRTLDEALSKYAREVAPLKRGERWEVLRIGLFRRTMRCVHWPMAEIEAPQIAEWRDARLKEISTASVRRELALLASVWEAARLEWRWTSRNPVRDIRKPANSRPRTRVIAPAEADALVLALGYTGGVPVTVSQRVAVALLFALETAMRAGEIAGIRAEHIRGKFVHLPETKNGTSRDVPLTPDAVALLALCPDGFGLTARQIDATFRKGRAKAAKADKALADIHFHDARRTATSAIAKKLTPMELAKVTGHQDLKTLLRVYYSVSAEDLADKLT